MYVTSGGKAEVMSGKNSTYYHYDSSPGIAGTAALASGAGSADTVRKDADARGTGSFGVHVGSGAAVAVCGNVNG